MWPRYKFKYQRMILEASRVEPTDTPEIIQKKVSSMWPLFQDYISCTWELQSGSFLKYGLSSSAYSDNFIFDITRNWKVPLNDIDPSDGKTLMDFIHDKIFQHKNAPHGPTVLTSVYEGYYRRLRDAGGLHRAEVESGSRISSTFERQKFDEARKRADSGNVSDVAELASLYVKGIGTPKDIKKGIELLESVGSRALAQKDVASMTGVANLFREGTHVPANPGRALYWYENAVRFEDSKIVHLPMYFLAMMYLGDQGVPKDVKKAAYWMKESATRGNRAAQEMLGKM